MDDKRLANLIRDLEADLENQHNGGTIQTALEVIRELISQPQEVFVVTLGAYDDYRIHAIWMSKEDASKNLPPADDDWGEPIIETWQIGQAQPWPRPMNYDTPPL